jgi:hypothetical protein
MPAGSLPRSLAGEVPRATLTRVADSLYLGADRSGVRWLLDPSAPGLADLAQAVQVRTEHTPCDPEAVAADLGMLPG